MAFLTPLNPNPADALATFLGVNPGGNIPQGAGDDPALALARLRGTRADELKARIPAEQATGDQMNGQRDLANLFGLQSDMNADPDTGVAAHQQVANTEDALNKASLSLRPEITDAAQAASDAKIKEARGLSEANAEGPLMAQTTPAGVAAEKFKTDEGIRGLAAKFGLEGGGAVASAPVQTTPEGVKWIDGSAFDKSTLKGASQAGAQQGVRIVADKNAVRSLHDAGNAEQTIKDIKDQILSLLPPDARSRPEAYLNNKLGAYLQTNETAAAFNKTIQPRALELYKTIAGMRGAGGMRLGPGIAGIAEKIVPQTTDTVGTTLQTLDMLSKALKNHRQETLGGVVGGQAPAQSAGDAQHFTMDANGNIVPMGGR